MRLFPIASAIALSVALFATSGCGSDAEPDTAPGGTGGSGGLAGGASGGTGGVSGSAGATGGGGAGGVGGTAGSSGAAGSGGNTCNDLGPEPNNSIALASPACGSFPCDVGQCDDDGSTGFGGKHAPIAGTIGPGDTDVFRYDGKDTIGFCQVNAVAKTDDSGFRLCLFPSCAASTVLQGCKTGTVETIDGGLKGCCITAPGSVEAQHDCTGTPTDNDSAEVFVRVDQANACVDYSVDYHF